MFAIATFLLLTARAEVADPSSAQPSKPPGSYADLVAFFREWRAFQEPKARGGGADFTAAAMEKQRRALPSWQARLEAFDTSAFTVEQQIDHAVVTAEMNGLDFDHRVLTPWSRDPAFYRLLHDGETDVPRREGPVHPNSIEIWRYPFPLPEPALGDLTRQVALLPAVLTQARTNLAADAKGARDLWFLGLRIKKEESTAFSELARQASAAGHGDLAAKLQEAKAAVDGFAAWLAAELPRKTKPSGIGVADYDWHLRHVQLVPLTWAQEVALHERELARARAQLALLEHQNRDLPPHHPVTDPAEWERVSRAAVSEFMAFLRDHDVMPVKDYFEEALMERRAGFVPEERRDFFYQIEFRDPLVMRCHGTHWFDRALSLRDPHPSPIRRNPSPYNLWVSRAEGLATATEEMMMSAGLFAGRPRARELVYILVANRAARGLAGLRQVSGEMSLEQALAFAHEHTPYHWLLKDGSTNWAEQELYLRQPFYGSSYLTGKAQIESLLAERHAERGKDFSLKRFYAELFDAGMIPVSLIRWQLTGKRPGE
jgi:hypothetical protein